MPLLIDGYNLLRAAQNISGSAALSGAGLCLMLSEFCRRRRQRGVIVFDGTGPPDKGPMEALELIEVIFSGPDREADAVIERLIGDNTAPRRLSVISTDRRIAAAAKRRRALSIRSEDFWPALCSTLEAKRRICEPAEKRSGISAAQAQKWLREFGMQ